MLWIAWSPAQQPRFESLNDVDFFRLVRGNLGSLWISVSTPSLQPVEAAGSLRFGYRLSLELADGTGNVNVMMHYCCWPCVCDVQDFVKVDTVTVTTRDQGEAKMHFAVIGGGWGPIGALVESHCHMCSVTHPCI